ncbi:hypothetical protein CN337_20435 [Bacillus anthracis]|nr:hypothetical protein CN337_20435 [Bacillus anthracis]
MKKSKLNTQKIYISKKQKELLEIEEQLMSSGPEDWWDSDKLPEVSRNTLQSIIDDIETLISNRTKHLDEINELSDRKILQIRAAMDHEQPIYDFIYFVSYHDPELTFLLSPKGYYRSGNDFHEIYEMSEDFFNNALNFIDKQKNKISTGNDTRGFKDILTNLFNEKREELQNFRTDKHYNTLG